MKSTKRILALILTLCLLVSFTVPVVWAEEGDPTIYSFTSDDGNCEISSNKSVTSGYTGLLPNTQHVFSPSGSAQWTYLNQSQTGRRIQISSSYMKIAFSSSDKTNYPFVAVQLDNVKAGSYNLSFRLALSTSGGLAKVYVVTKDAYNAAIQEWLGAHDSSDSPISSKAFATTADEHKVIYNALTNSALNDLSTSVLNCYNYDGAVSVQSIGKVSFETDGSYVLVIQCNGKAEQNANDNRNVQIVSLSLIPEVASVGNTVYGSLDTAITAAASAGDTVKLLGNVTAEKVTIPSGVTLDLNGYKLAANAVIVMPGANLVYSDGTVNGQVYTITAEDVTTATAVQAKIEAIGDVTLDDEVAINDAYTAYTALSDSQKLLVDIAPLDAAKQTLNGLKAVKDVQDRIDAIGDVTLDDEAAINEIAAAYQALSDANKKFVDTTKLVAAQQKLAELKNPGVVTPDESEGLVKSGYAAMSAIASTELRYTATAVVNGHDYMYMLFNGKTLLVYDLDTGVMVDRENNCFSTPRGLYIDPDGIVWVCGSSRMLYKYNPYTQLGEVIPYPADQIDTLFPVNQGFNSHGITGDGNGNLYYGTYNRTYVGKFNTVTNTWSRISEVLIPGGGAEDGLRSGFGGVVYHDGYVYMTVDGNANSDSKYTHMLIKYDLAKEEIAQYIDISSFLGTANWLEHLTLVDNVLLGSTYSPLTGTVAVDISGDEMKLITIDGMPNSFSGAVSAPRNGKVYMMSAEGKGLLEYDVATRSVRETGIAVGTGTGNNAGTLRCTAGNFSWVTIDHPDLPGESLVTFINDTLNNELDLIFYNPTSGKTVTITDYTKGEGSGNTLRSLAVSEDGKQVYVGAYEDNQLGVYDVEAGKIVDRIVTTSDQIEGMIWYDGTLYLGNYSAAALVRMDLENRTAINLGRLSGTPFYQQRIHASTSGDGKVFFGTGAGKNTYGGTLYWYDVDKNLVYVAAGPNPEDVFYFAGEDWKGQWYKALTGEPVSLDFNGDGTVSSADGVGANGERLYSGVVANQTPSYITYKDGYIYGCTSKHNGSGTDLNKYSDNSVLFVYDVNAMTLVAKHDLSISIPGIVTPIEIVDFVAADPDVEGKFWGVVSDTLFSFTFDQTTKLFNVKIELSFGVGRANVGGNGWFGRDVIFDGDFMYVSFGTAGTYMIHRENPSIYYKLSSEVPKRMVMAADSNIYYITNDSDLKVLYTAEVCAGIKDSHGSGAAQDMINALPDAASITLADEAAVIAARKAYDNLSEKAKAEIKNVGKLTAAEAAIAPLRAAADKAAADDVIAKINAIGTVTVESEDAITAARAAYEALTADQKKLVTNLAVLTAAEEALAFEKAPAADKEAATAAVAKIDAIGTVSRYSGDAIAAARSSYDALTKDQKALVKNFAVLTDAEAAYDALMKSLKTLYSFDYINSGLTYVGNSLYNKEGLLVYVEDNYKNGRLNWNVQEISYATTKNNDICFQALGYYQGRAVPGDWIAFTIKNPGAGVYDLTVTNPTSYCGAEEIEVYILPAATQDIGAALTADNLIGVFSCYDKAVEAEKPALSSLRTSELGSWTAGNAEEYTLVYRCAKASEEALALLAERLEKDPENTRDYGSNVYLTELLMTAADQDILAVQEMIDAIGTVTLESETAINNAAAAFAALTDEQKALVDITALMAAHDKLIALQNTAAADAVNAKINAIGTVTADSGAAIKAARSAYDALTDAQKALVSNLDKLTAAEAAYNDLVKDPDSPDTGDHMPLAALFCVLAASALVLPATVIYSKKKRA